MAVQSKKPGHGLADNLPLELAFAAVVAFILVVMAWKYVW